MKIVMSKRWAVAVKRGLCATVGVAMLAGSASAAVVEDIRLSEDFQNAQGNSSWEANDVPSVADSSFWNTTIQGNATESTSGGIYTADVPESSDRLSHDGGWTVDREVGFTIEFRMRVLEVSGTTSHVIHLREAAGESEDSTDGRIDFREDQIRWRGGEVGDPGTDIVYETDMSEFHTIRVAKHPGLNDDTYSMWINDELISEQLLPNSTTASSRITFGATSTAFLEGVFEYDYIRWDDTGAYVPEPGSLGLLSLGAAMLLARRRRDG